MQLCGSSADGSGTISGTIGVSPIGSLAGVGSAPSGLLLGQPMAGAAGGPGPQGPAGPVGPMGPAGGSVGSVDGGSP